MTRSAEAEVNALKRTRDRIADPAHWNQGSLAQDRNGEAVGPFSPFAVKWCLLGACDLEGATSALLYEAIQEFAGKPLSFAGFNDHYSHDDVLAVIDLAIQKAGSQP